MKRDRLAEETHQIITITVKTIVATVIAIKVADISKEEVVVKNLIAQNLKIKLKIFFPENKTKTRQDLSTKNFFGKLIIMIKNFFFFFKWFTTKSRRKVFRIWKSSIRFVVV
jgi:hypothetical protein